MSDLTNKLVNGEALESLAKKLNDKINDAKNDAIASAGNKDAALKTALQAEIDSDVKVEADRAKAAEATLQANIDKKANSSHGNHVPTTQTANNSVFLRNDNTWATVTPANIGAAPASHTSDTTSHITAAERTAWNAKSNLALGTTSTTAFRGDYGNTAYQHSQAAHAPSNAQKNSDITKTEIENKLTGDITTHNHNGMYYTETEINSLLDGKANSSHGTHVTYSTSAPAANGTASAGSANNVARGDHVHPLQTSVSGNAGSATKLATARNINGVAFDGTADITIADSTKVAPTGTIVANRIAVFNDTTGKVIKDSGFTIATSVPANAKFTDTVYTHPSAHDASMITQSSSYRFVTDTEKSTWNAKSNLALGTTSSTAFRGDQGLTAYNHSQAAHAPSNAQKNSDITKAEIEAKLTGNITSHTHDSLNAIDLSNKTASLNDYNLSSGTPKVAYYFCPTDGGGANITGRPNDSTKQAFNLRVESLRFASTTDYITKQTYTMGSQKITYVRYCTNGTWTAWEKIYTSAQKPTPSEIGASESGHTHNYAGSSSVGGAATSANKVNSNLAVKLNGGTTEGTNLFTFNGSAAKTIDITPAAIGASASGHNHDDRYFTESEINTKINTINTSISTAQTNAVNSAKSYTDTAITNLVNSAPDAMNTLKELADAIDAHQDVYEAYVGEMTTALAGKANSSHGNHVPAVQTASNSVFLRNDNTWASVTPANIGAAPTSHASTGTSYGVSSASNYGHAMASSTTPKANGTAAVGSETAKFARGDHVHPLQTTVSGNAGSATKLQTARTLTLGGTGKTFDGSGNVSWTLSEIANGQEISGRVTFTSSAADQNLRTRGIVGYDITNKVTGDLYLQYQANAPIHLGSDGSHTISADGSQYTGNAGSATKLATARNITIGNKTNSFNGTAAISYTLADIGAAPISHSAHVAYGTCSTAAATAEKAITIADTNWTLQTGTIVMAKFSTSNTASSVKLNVNSTGAYPIWYNNAEYTGNGNKYTGYANRVITYMFNGTHWVWISGGIDDNTTYSNASLGQGYATCDTAESTTAKVGTLSSYSLQTGGVVSVKFTYNVPASATLNVNSKGAKSIYFRGAAITANIIKAGDIATFIYNGSQYQLIAIDRWQNDLTSHTHNYAGSSSAGGAATSANKVNQNMIIKLNGGSTEGTNLFTFNGSAAKTINITPSSIGAAASHNHDAYVNQNAFANVTVGSTTIAADAAQDTITFVAGDNVTITPDATNDKITIAAKDTVYTHPSAHAATMITEDTSHRFVTDAEKSTWNAKSNLALGTTSSTAFRGDYGNTAYTHSQAAHAPSNAQKNSDITKAEIEAKLTGTITSHNHSGTYAPATHNHTSLTGITSLAFATDTSDAGSITTTVSGTNTYFDFNLSDDATQSDTWRWRFTPSGGSLFDAMTLDATSNTAAKLTVAGEVTASTFTGSLNGNATSATSAATADKVVNSLSIQLNGGTATVFDGSAARSINITPAAIGAAASSHGTHVTWATNAPSANGTASTGSVARVAREDHVHPLQTSVSGSSGSCTGNAASATKVNQSMIVKLNGGTTEGTNLFTFNGSAAKTINITPSSIGAAASSHGTHVTYGTATPKANGTAAVGTSANVAREDHIHPLQTTISGNAGSATKVNNNLAIKLNGGTTEGTNLFTFNGSAAKTVNITPAAIGIDYITTSIIDQAFTDAGL